MRGPYNALPYTAFCTALGAPDNDYSRQKWTAFKLLHQNLCEFDSGTLLRLYQATFPAEPKQDY